MDERKRHYPARRSLNDLENRSNIVFVTICTHRKSPILARPDIHKLLIDVWSAPMHWSIGRYVVMPDHIHLFCSPAQADAVNVRDWIAYWKSMTSRKWPRPAEKPVWQREAWDRQIRRGESYAAKWDYVRNNPVRHGLVKRAEDWPYQGELSVLRWHDL